MKGDNIVNIVNDIVGFEIMSKVFLIISIIYSFREFLKRTGYSSIFTYSPEMHCHEEGRDERQPDAMEDIKAQESRLAY